MTNAVVPSVLRVEITNGEAVVPAARVLNVEPPSVEYLYVVIAEPPVAPAVKATDRVPSDGVIVVIVGALGVVAGVAAVVEDAVPSPIALTAFI